ncbi:hypothetical protein BCR44DRAFT_258317 [Catenaria anguillulae PL171]|uniref:Uncharacterized protein n=1 Tax=Catenaria anguillulae PL171 TaxID=765915 RepID=A0A1Y2HJQ9_9FUNG|nr:hypothetical protein BCR44DRAFT_258317 [Catenaria anguillulae PL171]
MTIVREGTRRALVVLVYESKAGNIRSARLVQPRWPRAYVRHEHVDPKRYVAVLAPPPSSPWAVGPYVHVQLFTHRRDVFTVEIGKLRIVKGELAGKLTEQEAELAKWTRKLGEEKKKVAELETRLTTLKRALGVVDGDRLPLELFVEVVDQYREIAKLQYAGKRVDQVLVKALGESVERFFYRRC